jgi:hypothetical protein
MRLAETHASFGAEISRDPGSGCDGRRQDQDSVRTGKQDPLAGDVDDPQRQPPARQWRRPEGRRAPGLVGLAVHHHDGALFRALRPEDRVAVKPHASPCFHAIQYLLGNQTREKLKNFRGYKGAQSYPSRTKDIDDVDFSTGSVGLGVAQTLFASLAQDYVKRQGLGARSAEGAWSR